jgi:hypothetical protein
MYYTIPNNEWVQYALLNIQTLLPIMPMEKLYRLTLPGAMLSQIRSIGVVILEQA